MCLAGGDLKSCGAVEDGWAGPQNVKHKIKQFRNFTPAILSKELNMRTQIRETGLIAVSLRVQREATQVSVM